MSRRHAKMAHQLRRVVGEYLQTQWPERPRDILFSITNVILSPDMHYATIHVSTFPANQEETILHLLTTHVKTIQQYLNKQLRTRPVPRLTFTPDHSEEARAAIDALLRDERTKQ